MTNEIEKTHNSGKKPSLIERVIKSGKEAFNKAFRLPSDEEARDKFSEAEKKEMLESLKMADNFDLYSISMKDISEETVTMKRWDTTDFKKWIVQKDKIWKYIMINWVKCREYKEWSGISGFVYQDIRDKNENKDNWLKIWFSDKGNFKKYVTIDWTWEIETINLPSGIEKALWWPFYEVNKQNNGWPLSKISRNDLYSPLKQKEEDIAARYRDGHTRSENWENNKKWSSFNINWIEFKPFEKGTSWFIYQEFIAPGWDNESKILLAEYKDWKMVGEWVILSKDTKTYFMKHDKQDK